MLIDKFKRGSSWVRGLTIVPNVFENAFDLLVASFVINVLSLAIPLTLMQVYDRIIPYQAMSTLSWLFAGCSVAVALDGLLRFCRAQISNWMAARFEHFLSCSVVERILASRLSDFEQDGLGKHLDRVNSVSTLRNVYAGQIFQVLLDIPFAAMFVAAIWYLAGDLAYFPVAVIGVYFLFIFFIKKKFETARKEQVDAIDRRFNFIFELLAGIHLVKAQTTEEQMLRRHERLQAGTAIANMSVSKWNATPIIFGSTFSLITMFGIIGAGSGSVIDGSLTVGGLAACMLLAGRALQPVQSAAGFWLRFSEASIARNRISDIAAYKPEISAGMPPFPHDIDGRVELKNVSFRYDKDLDNIVNGLSVKIEPNEMIGILGKSSSGTTTLARLIIGEINPDEGMIFVDDYNIHEWDRTNLQGRIDYLPQSGTLFKGTIIENISMFDPNRHAAATDAAALLRLDDLVALLPQGYETVVDSQATNFLPSGLIQRICIARALVVRPRVLIFDKTDASMDSDSQESFHWLLNHLKGKCTIIIITNKPQLLQLADKNYELFYGILRESNADQENSEVEDITAIFD